MAKKTDPDYPFIACRPVALPEEEVGPAAETAVKHNPANRPPVELAAMFAGLGLGGGGTMSPQRIAVLTSKYWGANGVKLGVQFMDSPDAATRKLILAHMNAWNKWANVTFAESRSGQVRLTRTPGGGYWSYLGTDILHVNGPTMNLESFTSQTPLSEYKRVVRHETGHTLGCPHEHSRGAIVALLDPERTIATFAQLYGWNRQTVVQQVLTPISEASIMGTPADRVSIMCYQFDGSCTRSGQPIPGGLDIDPTDGAFMAKLYPKRSAGRTAKK